MNRYRVLLFGRWNRRCYATYYFRRAFAALGCEVVGMGPWEEDEPWGTHGREPDIEWPERGSPRRQPAEYDYASMERALGYRPDLLFLCDQGEHLVVPDIPAGVRWVHYSAEGVAMDWSRGQTPYRYASIMCNGADDGVTWLPNGYDPVVHPLHPDPGMPREYDLIQVAAPRPGRQWLWKQLYPLAPDLHIYTGEFYGPLYAAAHHNARAAWVCATYDFITMHTFEAMAMGCIVLADRHPIPNPGHPPPPIAYSNALTKLFTEGEHFIGYDSLQGPDWERVPDPRWLIEMAREIKAGQYAHIAPAARAAVARHRYQDRAAQVLAEVFS